MTESEKHLEQTAVRWVRRPGNKQILINKFASTIAHISLERPFIVFTAGSPGAGKTEFIQDLHQRINAELKVNAVIIDPDALREFLPGYTGNNSYLFQRPVSIAVDDLFRTVLKRNQSAFMDGTLAQHQQARKNIKQVVDKYGIVMICFIFQHPKVAWHFTQLREAVEGRKIRKSDFIDKLLGAKNTVDELKAEFGDKIILNVIVKGYKDTEHNKTVAKAYYNVETIDAHLDFRYTKNSLQRILSNETI